MIACCRWSKAGSNRTQQIMNSGRITNHVGENSVNIQIMTHSNYYVLGSPRI